LEEDGLSRVDLLESRGRSDLPEPLRRSGRRMFSTGGRVLGRVDRPIRIWAMFYTILLPLMGLSMMTGEEISVGV
jgi:hypothetical protein